MPAGEEIHLRKPSKEALSDYRGLLMELVIAYLLRETGRDSPSDYLHFALDFFYEKRRERTAPQAQAVEEDLGGQLPDLPEEDEPRRATIYAGSLDDEDFDNLPEFPKSEETKKNLMESLESLFLFRYLDSEQIRRIIDALEKRRVERGEMLIREGSEGDYFYVIEKGNYQAFTVDAEGRKTVAKTYEGSGCFGELAMLYNVPRSYDVQALTPGKVYTLDTYNFRKIVEGCARKRREFLKMCLTKVESVKNLTDEEVQAVIDNLVYRIYKSGQKIFSQGETADGLYIIFRGTVIGCRDEAPSGGQAEATRTYGPGDHFGEMSLLVYTPRLETAVAKTEVQVAFLEVNKFERLFGSCLEILQRNEIDYKRSIAQLRTLIRSPQDLRMSQSQDEGLNKPQLPLGAI